MIDEKPPKQESQDITSPATSEVSQPQTGQPIDKTFEILYRSYREYLASPFPSADTLAEYEEKLSGSAERIMRLIEKEAEHRQCLELRHLDSDIEDRKAERVERKRGQVFGLTIGIVAIVGGVITSVLGYPWPGGIMGTGGVVGLVSVFVVGRIWPSSDESESEHENEIDEIDPE